METPHVRIRCMSTIATHSTNFIPANRLLVVPGGAATFCRKGQVRKGKGGRVERVGGWRFGRLEGAEAVKEGREGKVKVKIKAKVKVTVKWNGVVPTCEQSGHVPAHVAPCKQELQRGPIAHSPHTPLRGQETPHSVVHEECTRKRTRGQHSRAQVTSTR